MLECLPNEILLQIYSFLELTELDRAFSSLNSRFECLLYDTYAPLHARFTSQLTFPFDKFYSRIVHLSLIDCVPTDVSLLLEQSDLLRLRCLNITSTNHLYFGQVINDLIHRILSLTNLHQCQIKLSSTLYVLHNHLPISSSIRHLTLSMITLDMLFHLLMHIPKLCSLNVWLNSNGRIFDSRTYDQYYNCLNLKKLTIGLHNDIIFAEILFLLRRMPVLHSLVMVGTVWDQEYLNDNHWNNVLSGDNLFPLLNQIKINLSIRHTTHTPHVNLLLSRFNRDIFRRTHFSVTSDRMFWLYLSCLWSH